MIGPKTSQQRREADEPGRTWRNGWEPSASVSSLVERFGLLGLVAYLLATDVAPGLARGVRDLLRDQAVTIEATSNLEQRVERLEAAVNERLSRVEASLDALKGQMINGENASNARQDVEIDQLMQDMQRCLAVVEEQE